MFNRATRLSSLLLCLSAAGNVATAQTTATTHSTAIGSNVQLVPVPVESVQPQGTPVPRVPSNANLRWRRSDKVPTLKPEVANELRHAPTHRIPTGAQRSAGIPAPVAQSPSGVMQATWVSPQRPTQVSQAPAGTQPQGNAPVSNTRGANYFQDPFGEARGSRLIQTPQQPRTEPSVEMIVPPVGQAVGETQPVGNELLQTPVTAPQETGGELPPPVESSAPSTQPPFEMPALPAETTTPIETSPIGPQTESATPPTESRSFGEMLREQPPRETTPPPTPLDQPESLFEGDTTPPAQQEADRDRAADEADRDRLQQRSSDGSYVDDGIGSFGSIGTVGRAADFSCEDFRKRIAAQTIDLVSLDVSPPFRPDEFDQGRYERLREAFLERQSIRQWRNRQGEPMAVGRLIDLAYEKAVIETESGQIERLPINRISEGDIAYITDNWGLPKECLVEQIAYTPRQWAPVTMTWTASNLCHTPLYFEDVNLERYGHTHGPLLEPFVQSAHFFGGILVLPYKMGVHPPNECQYALGYYRPGSCAPWIKPPVPISARGAIAQAATMTGMFWLIP
ncbi:MAG: hypothetical protein AAGI63_16715 [Planctomycetota bacterium]